MRTAFAAFAGPCACLAALALSPAALLAAPGQAAPEEAAPAKPNEALGRTYTPADPLADAKPAPTKAEAKAALEAAKAEDRAAMEASAKVVQASLDAWRARNFEGWIATYAPDVLVVSDQMRIVGRKELRAIYRTLFDVGLPAPKIVKSGWTGNRVFVVQEEFLPGGTSVGKSYAEYEVNGGLITSVYGKQM
ncbi:MAG: nuclear transport factor 2 family protein [Pseudomonadota bacterium]